MTVIALDPGGTTGVCLWEGNGEPKTFQFGPERHHRMLYNYLSKMCPEALIAEDFTWTTTPADLISVEYIGICELYAQHRSGMPFIRQGRSCKSFWDDDKIKAVGLWVPGQPHAMDALRHLLYYQMNRGDHRFIHRLRHERQP